jgi:adenosine/AMP kinase
MTTSTEYKGLVRLKDGTKEKYTVAKDVGTVEDAVKCLLTDVPNARVGIVLVPPSEHFVTPEAT